MGPLLGGPDQQRLERERHVHAGAGLLRRLPLRVPDRARAVRDQRRRETRDIQRYGFEDFE